MMRALQPWIAGGLALLGASASGEEFVKIASWNIENLGQRAHGQHPKALAEFIQLAGADVIALQEIHDTDGQPDERTSRKLDDALSLLNALPGQSWEYRLFPNTEAAQTERLCGVLWNKRRVSMSGSPFRIPLQVDPPDPDVWERHPHAVKFSTQTGKTDIVVIPVHMKSNIDGVQYGKEKRELEAKALVSKLPEVKAHFHDDDVIILGDTNCKDGGEPALRLFRSAGFTDLNAGDVTTYVKGEGAPFDRILVPHGQPEFRFSRQYVLLPTEVEAYLDKLSDHCMVLAMVKVDDDDDTAP